AGGVLPSPRPCATPTSSRRCEDVPASERGRLSSPPCAAPSSSLPCDASPLSAAPGSCGRILVHAAATLPAEPPRGDVLLEQRTGAELVAERPVQETEDR